MKRVLQIVLILAAIFLVAKLITQSPEERSRLEQEKKKVIFASKELVLGDFETSKELKEWKKHGVLAYLSDEHAVRGKQSVKLAYMIRKETASFMLSTFFRRDRRARDWRGYETLTLTLFNPSPEDQRLLMQFKDAKNGQYKESLLVPAKGQLAYQLPLDRLAPSLDLREIMQFNLFVWEPRSPQVFFLDDVRLIPRQRTGREKEVVSVEESVKEPAPSEKNVPANVVSGLLFPRLSQKWQAASATTGETFLRVPIDVVRAQPLLYEGLPVSGGVPFPYGLLKSTTSFRLTTMEGEEFPLQIRPLAFWEDGSVKWLLVDTQLVNDALDKHLLLEIHQTPPPPPASSPLRVVPGPSAITVVTGPLAFSISKERFTLFQDAFLDQNGDGKFTEEERVSSGGDLVIRHRGSDYRSSLSRDYTLTVEEVGPLRVTLRADGWLKNANGERFCQYRVRIQAFAGKSDVRLYHTFIYTGYPANKYHYEYQNVELPENETIEEIAVESSFMPKAQADYQVGLPKGVLVGKLKEPLLLAQGKYNQFRLMHGAETVHEGEKALGWIDLSSDSSGWSVGIRDFWQQVPKEILVDPAGSVKLSLWPASAGPLDLQTQAVAYGPDAVARGSAFGLAKTHELLFSFHPNPLMPQTLHEKFSAFQTPPLLHADSEWIYESYALGALGPHKPSVEAESLLALLLDWAQRQPKLFNWYGMLDYGDVLSWYRKEAYDKSYPEWGWHPEGRWGWFGCEQVGPHAAFLLQFARTGQYKYFDFGEASARHVMDVDTIHYDTVTNDPRLNGKIIADHSHVGGMHRHNANHWGDRAEEASHTHVLGFLLYYYLTGYERAFDVAKEVGSFCLRDPVTYTRHPEIAPQRAIANVLWNDTLLYEATLNRQYKKGADRWADVLVRGQKGAGGWGEDYDPRSDRWSENVDLRFMALHTLPALIVYHQLTGDSRVKEAILRGTVYLIENEKYFPFFDALAYCYEVTGDARYLAEAQRRLGMQVNAQIHSENPVWNGCLFGKATYDHVPPLVYGVPYLLGVRNPAILLPYQREEFSGKGGLEPPSPSYDVRVVSSLERVFQNGSLEGIGQSNPVQLALAANEYESTQLVLSSPAVDLKGVRIQAEDLVNGVTGAKISKDQIAISPIGFVNVRKSDYYPRLRGPMPDPLPAMEIFEVKRGKLQPVWLTLHVPPGTPPGFYRGSVSIQPENDLEKKVTLEVTVWDFELPARSRLKTAFDLYPTRLVSAYKNYFPQWWARWQNDPDALEDAYYEKMLRYRISPILNIDPSRKEQVGRVKRLAALGLNAFGIGHYGGSFDNNWPDDLSAVLPLYRDYARILRGEGLLSDAYLYAFDELPPGEEKVAKVSETIHQADPSLKNLVVLQETPAYAPLAKWFEPIDIVCLRNTDFNPSQAEAIRKAGKELWIYCSGPKVPYPTLVIDYPTMAYRILPWMCWKYKATGLLYWCVNFWTKNPYLDPMNTPWDQNGNGSLFYPGPVGPVGSIRLELLRDGIEDYDMLAILSDRIVRAKEKGLISSEIVQQAQKVLNDAEALVPSMRDYPQEPDRLYKLRNRIAEAIVALKDAS